jgi:HEAT repeat protein
LVLACGLPAVSGHQAVRPAASRRATIAAIEDARAPTAADVRVLAQIAGGADARLASAATRALGRLERRDLVSDLIPLLSSRFDLVHDEAANALAQSFRGAPLANVSSAGQLQMVFDALAATQRKSEAVYRAIGRLPYETVDQVRSAEAALATALNVPMVPVGALRGLESLARLQRRLAPLDETTLALVRDVATGAKRTPSPDVRRNALAVLVAAQGADEATIESALQDADEEVRRLAVLLLGGAASAVASERRTGLIRSALGDTSPMVRFEAVRAWARRGAADQGCAPLLDALGDASAHVALAAIDALGDQCRDDDTVADRLTALARTPPSTGDWQREAHALVALSKRAPDRAAIALLTFAMHPNWQVRMYAARAAAQLDDVATLQRLAVDAEDTVVETVLPALRKRTGAESDQAFVAALNRRTRTVQSRVLRPYQVFREAAIGLKGAQSTPAIVEALLGALQRTTAEQCETSRDARLAIIERIAELGSAAQVASLTPLLSDIDPRVAVAAAVSMA